MTPEVRKLLASLESGGPLNTGQMELVHCRINDRQVTFCVDMEKDPIQRHHRHGKYYETPELEFLRTIVKPGGIFIDIGANTGNHALFFALELRASRVIPIEPNPLVYRLLISNAAVNGLLDVIDLGFLGVGLSDKQEGGYAMEQRARNIGGARMLPGAGDIETHPGDALFGGLAPDFVKVDVEGMEMQVLRGLETTIATHRPLLFVEVDVGNDAEFHAWRDRNRYDTENVWQRYKANRNYLLTPAA